MSTKIYNGARVLGHTLESFLVEVHRMRPVFREAAQSCMRQAVVNIASSDFDRQTLGLDETAPPRSYIGAAYIELMDRQFECQRTGQRNPFIDHQSEVVVIPVEGQLLAIPYIDNPILRRLLVSQPWWQEFGYWDNTDEEEGVSEADWKERERLWSLALPDGLPPAQAGYTVTILASSSGQHDMTDEMLTPLLPTLEERVHRSVDWFRDAPLDLGLAPDASRDERRLAIAEYIKPRLVQNLTIPMLRRRQ
jgi:hypothetical protein